MSSSAADAARVYHRHPTVWGLVSERLLGPPVAGDADAAARAVLEVLWTPDERGRRFGARRAFDVVLGALVDDIGPLRHALAMRVPNVARADDRRGWQHQSSDEEEAQAARREADVALVCALDDARLVAACRRLYAPLRRAARPRPFLDFLRL